MPDEMYSDDLYNEQGANLAALEMIENTREENAKYGELEVRDNGEGIVFVIYANGFEIRYDENHQWIESFTLKDNKFLFKYFDRSLTSGEEIKKYLHGLGVGFKGGYGETVTFSNGDACIVKFKEGHAMTWGKNGSLSLIFKMK